MPNVPNTCTFNLINVKDAVEPNALYSRSYSMTYTNGDNYITHDYNTDLNVNDELIGTDFYPGTTITSVIDDYSFYTSSAPTDSATAFVTFETMIPVNALTTAFTWAYSPYFDDEFSGSKNSLYNFRNYGNKPYHSYCQISAGGLHTLTILKTGVGWNWNCGSNYLGQLGNNSVGANANSPVSISGLRRTFCKISGGAFHTAVINNRGQVWTWGYGQYGTLGDNNSGGFPIYRTSSPNPIAGVLKTFCQINAGRYHTVGITNRGRAWTWGGNANAQLGNNSTQDHSTPIAITTKTFCRIDAGQFHTVSLDNRGKAWCWGNNYYGQLGNNKHGLFSERTPVSIYNASTHTFCEISSGPGYNGDDFIVGPGTTNGSFTLVLDNHGKVWGWGYNGFGQLGDNTTSNRSVPVSVIGTTTFCEISAGDHHSLAIDNHGQVWAWGFNEWGQLGNNSTQTSQGGTVAQPISISGVGKTFCSISAGMGHTVAIDNYHQAWGWGLNIDGQLGSGTTSRKTPFAMCKIYK